VHYDHVCIGGGNAIRLDGWRQIPAMLRARREAAA